MTWNSGSRRMLRISGPHQRFWWRKAENSSHREGCLGIKVTTYLWHEKEGKPTIRSRQSINISASQPGDRREPLDHVYLRPTYCQAVRCRHLQGIRLYFAVMEWSRRKSKISIVRNCIWRVLYINYLWSTWIKHPQSSWMNIQSNRSPKADQGSNSRK